MHRDGEAGVACGREGQEAGVKTKEDVGVEVWVSSKSVRSEAIMTVNCVPMVEKRSEVLKCDIAPIECREAIQYFG